MGNAGEHQRRAFLLNRGVLHTCEMQLLVGRQMEPVVNHTHVNRTYILRTLGHHNGVGFERPGGQVPKRAPG